MLCITFDRDAHDLGVAVAKPLAGTKWILAGCSVRKSRTTDAMLADLAHSSQDLVSASSVQ